MKNGGVAIDIEPSTACVGVSVLLRELGCHLAGPVQDDLDTVRTGFPSYPLDHDEFLPVAGDVVIENHWGIAADPMNIRIIIHEVASPYCEASPDFCNWEHEYMLYHGLEVLAPFSSSMVHAKRWTRYPNVDIARCVRIFTDAGYRGYFAMEYEEEGDGVQGSIQLMEDVLAALD